MIPRSSDGALVSAGGAPLVCFNFRINFSHWALASPSCASVILGSALVAFRLQPLGLWGRRAVNPAQGLTSLALTIDVKLFFGDTQALEPAGFFHATLVCLDFAPGVQCQRAALRPYLFLSCSMTSSRGISWALLSAGGASPHVFFYFALA